MAQRWFLGPTTSVGMSRRIRKDLEAGADVPYAYDGWRAIAERELK